MRVHGFGNNPGYGQGPTGPDRAGKDGHRQGQEHEQQKKKPQDEDEVELHAPNPADPSAAPPVPLKPQKPPSGKQPPLDLSA